MSTLKCKMCGGTLQYEEGKTVVECEYCGSVNTLPNIGDEKRVQAFNRANTLRSNCSFEMAAGVYESIVTEYPEEAEAYWGLILCKYGIEYVDDPATGKKVPTCHRSSFDELMEDENFKYVMEFSDPGSRKVYREEAKQIEEIRKGILEISSKEEPYDVFICYKETDDKGERTIDSTIAQEIYDSLTAKNYRVFFARITLEDKLGQEYEPYIFAALNSAKVMLVIGTDYDNFNAVWVKNEWSRYLKLMEKDKSKHLIPCYRDIDAYDMPKEFSKLQAQDMSKVGAVQDVVRGVEKLISVKSVATTANGDAIEFLMKDRQEREAKKKKYTRIAIIAIIVIAFCIVTTTGIVKVIKGIEVNNQLSEMYGPLIGNQVLFISEDYLLYCEVLIKDDKTCIIDGEQYTWEWNELHKNIDINHGDEIWDITYIEEGDYSQYHLYNDDLFHNGLYGCIANDEYPDKKHPVLSILDHEFSIYNGLDEFGEDHYVTLLLNSDGTGVYDGEDFNWYFCGCDDPLAVVLYKDGYGIAAIRFSYNHPYQFDSNTCTGKFDLGVIKLPDYSDGGSLEIAVNNGEFDHVLSGGLAITEH